MNLPVGLILVLAGMVSLVLTGSAFSAVLATAGGLVLITLPRKGD